MPEIIGSAGSGIAALRERPVLVRADRQAVAVAGPDAEAYLQGQCSQDIAALTRGEAADALLLSPQGKLQALVRVIRLSEDEFVVDVDHGFLDVVLARLLQFRLRVKVEIETLPWRCVALRGPGTAELVAGPLLSGTAVVVPVDWGSVTGADLLGPDPTVPAGVPAITDDAWQVVRIEAGIPVMGAELDTRTIAAEAGLVGRAVSLTKGCYTGQELVARLDARGNRVARYLRGLLLPDPGRASVGPPGGADAEEGTWVGAEIVSATDSKPDPAITVEASDRAADVTGRSVGRITSAAWSPARRSWVALAYVHRSIEPPAPVVAIADASSGGTVRCHGEVRALPFSS